MAFSLKIPKSIADKLKVIGSPIQAAKNALQFLQGKAFSQVTKGKNRVARPKIGKMYMMIYKAKGDGVLPFWDRQPVVIAIEKYKDGFLGMNFHYIPPLLRFKLLAALMSYATNPKIPSQTKLRLSYSLLKNASKAKFFKPTVHRYLYSQMKTPLVLIPFDQWKFIIALPLQKWKGASSGRVYADSRKKF